jgi:hypothetical protein
MKGAALVLLAAAALAGCGGAGDESPRPDRLSSDEKVVRHWLSLLEKEDYGAAADLFVRGALVAQGPRVFRLETREEAVLFNATLPCRADVAGLRRDGRYTLVTFDLRLGPLGGCRNGGQDRVRFLIRDGRIREWRRLVDEEQPPDTRQA